LAVQLLALGRAPEQLILEPNSGIGEAFNYFLKRWDKF
jgi:hypothetical protein